MSAGEEPDAKESSHWRSYLRLVGSAVRAHRGKAALILGALVLEMSFNAAVPLSFKLLVDHAILPRNQEVLFTILGALVIGVIVVAIAGLARDYHYARLSSAILRDLRMRIFEHLQLLSMDYYARTRVADIQARFSSDLASVENALTAALPWGALPALDLLVSGVLLFVLEWRLALLAMLAFPISLIGPRFVAARAASASYQRKQDESAVATEVQENLVAQAVVKAFGLQKRARTRFGASIDKLARAHVRVSFLNSLLERSSGIGTMVLQVTVLGVGAAMAFDGSLTVGSLASFQALFLTMSYSLGYVAQYFPYIVHAGAGMRRIEELLGESPRVADSAVATAVPRPAAITFERVTFGYTADRTNLVDVGFELRAGESVAFVGASGSGKSTVLTLLMRFYDPDSGRVRFDDHDLRGVTQHSLRDHLGVVFQDSILFDTTIRENIRIGKLDANDAEIEAAARAAEIHDIILAMPDGYDTMVGERGGKLSGGQRQRIAIARAIIRDPGVLLLDEATSALDAATEDAINKTIERVSHGRTVVSVTHRLSAVAAMDRICVLDKGRLVEQGPHRDLIEAGGFYARLWEKQHGFRLDEGQQHVEAGRLRAIPIFAKLDDKLLEALNDLIVVERHPANRAVFDEGDPGDKLYIVARGRVAVFVTKRGFRCQLDVLDDGDYFGEIALLEDTPRTASVQTLTECTFLALPRDAFRRLLDKAPELRSAIEAEAEERLAELTPYSAN